MSDVKCAVCWFGPGDPIHHRNTGGGHEFIAHFNATKPLTDEQLAQRVIVEWHRTTNYPNEAELLKLIEHSLKERISWTTSAAT